MVEGEMAEKIRPSLKIINFNQIELMSKEEMKNEINKVLDKLSDKTLQDILSLLKNIEGKQALSLTDPVIVDKILSEDKDLLQKLAQ